jgi:methionyl aminopeptidase
MIAKPKDYADLRIAGTMLAQVLDELGALVAPGVPTSELDLAAERAIRDRGGVPAFLGYKPDGAASPYPAVLCVSVNDEVVHGIPTEDKVLQNGDLVSLDLGLSYNGYFVDAARTVCVGTCDAETLKLIDATRQACAAAIAAAKVGNHIGDIGAAVVRVAQEHKLTIVEELGGHAVGRAVHEKPFIANDGEAGEGEKIVEGLVLAIEPMLTAGKGAIVLDKDDKWTYLIKDGSRAAHFEDTVLITSDGPEILTRA